jgi:serine/threonine protein kinase
MTDELFDNKYKFIKSLGSGGFGNVFLAMEEHSDNLVAIKQLNNFGNTDQEDIIHETQVVSKFNHPHIVSYKHNFIQNKKLHIVMEYCPMGSMRRLMDREKITSSFVWKWMLTITETMQSIHAKGIIHHDIKPENILFTQDRVLKIADFGIANSCIGTRGYISPKLAGGSQDFRTDERADVYALGITLLELLTGKNPFLHEDQNAVMEIHEQKKYNLEGLPNWQQEIVLKAIAPEPELRFQSMKEFNEAIQSQAVPFVLDKEIIKAGNLAEKATALMNSKKWLKALSLLDYAEREFKPSVNVLYAKGKYYLLQKNIELAKSYFERALTWNPRLDVQKELGWINLEMKNYPKAISFLSDYIHRKPSDYEAYNLLIQCFYETNRYEQGMDLAKTLLDVDETNQCFANNYYLNYSLFTKDKDFLLSKLPKPSVIGNEFIDYNYSVINEKDPTYGKPPNPSLKSKLLFMDYRFNKFIPAKLYCLNTYNNAFKYGETQKPIIKFGREGFIVNEVEVQGDNDVSRRHCVIINSKDDVWLYDFSNSGTFVNDERVINKAPLIGMNIIRIAHNEYEITTDKGKLF